MQVSAPPVAAHTRAGARPTRRATPRALAEAAAVFGVWLAFIAGITAADNLIFVRPESWSAELYRIVGSWDASWLRKIAESGYGWKGSAHATLTLNFLPLYPLLERGVHSLTGWSWTADALVINLILQYSFLAVLAYALASIRPEVDRPVSELAVIPGQSVPTTRSRARLTRSRMRTLILIVAYPASLFVVQGYAEALFLFLQALAILSIMRHKSTLAYLFAGIACAADPAAWALPVGYALYQWGQSRDWMFPLRPRQCFRELLGISGLLATMLYYQIQFHDALGKFQAGQNWFPVSTKAQLALNTLTLRPLRNGLSIYFQVFNVRSFSYTLDAFVLIALVAAIVVVWRRGGTTWHVVVAAVGVIPIYIQAVEYTYTYSVTRLSYPLWLVLAFHPWVRQQVGERSRFFRVALFVEIAVGLVWMYLLVYGQWIN